MMLTLSSDMVKCNHLPAPDPGYISYEVEHESEEMAVARLNDQMDSLLAMLMTPAREPNDKFKDCFDRPIAIGDVLAHGFRAGNYGGINVGVVYGFTEHSLQLYRVEEVYHCEHSPYKRVHDGWKFVKSLTRLSENTFITGLTEAQLRQELDIVSGTMGHEIGHQVAGYEAKLIAIDEVSND